MTSKLKKLAVLIAPGMARPSICEACGSEFSCGASLKGCWCSEIKISDETRAELKARYRDCLCRECLERLTVDNDR
jgi:Cysteine-rich CWC